MRRSQIIRHIFLLLCLGVAPVSAMGSELASLRPIDAVLNFEIQRNGEKIGDHRISIHPVRGKTQVSIKSDIDYRLAFIPVYTFNHAASELWEQGRFVELNSHTNDNGDTHKVSLVAGNDLATVNSDGSSQNVQGKVLPSSLWHFAMTESPRLVDSVDGEVMHVEVESRKTENVRVRGRDISARYVNMIGDMKRELWYDQAGLLVKVRFKAEDGSEVQFNLQ